MTTCMEKASQRMQKGAGILDIFSYYYFLMT